MNAKHLPAISLFLPAGGAAPVANWTVRTDIHSGTGDGNHLDFVEGISGKGQSASRPNPEDHNQRYEADSCNGTRGAIAGLAEAFRCALGISKDRQWMDYVMERRQAITMKAEAIFDVQSNAGDAS